MKALLRPTDPRELVRKWQSNIRADQRNLDKEIRDIRFEEKKALKAVKDAAKRGDMQSARLLAREIAASRKVVNRLYVSKAQLTNLNCVLNEQLAMLRIAGTIGKSTDIMKVVNDMMKMPKLRETCVEFQKEMFKAGIIEEMMDDAMGSALDTEESDELADAEVEAVLQELTTETSKRLPSITKTAAAAPQGQAGTSQEVEEQESEDDLEDLHARLEAIRN